ncbi:alpha/beta hydrolase fold domain-containing protein [Pseudoduganella eburnea]|uniref:Alpha/beta hydrolase fold domain-containing protein n=1 Tax=Massilia eburnea TaxID=1776165 RepID=A0A6L6QGR4_9BURK|nr:alpha/beta hydrolase [Massilia eburnea]MTW11562.1 alpha/beta hydrolase fold domain-containing protein [Massilia eburnea]
MRTVQWLSALLVQITCILSFTRAAHAENLIDRQSRVWQPPAEALEIPLWPKGPPSPSTLKAGRESYGFGSKQIAGRPYVAVEFVSRPTMSIFRPHGKDSGATVVVFPGGGYRILAIDLEGTEICDWLTSKGITCVLLKYRVPGSGPYWNEECNCRRIPDQPYALQDAQRAIGLLRARAEEFGIDPRKIGVIGFSAGGHMAAEISNHTKRSYKAIDKADQQSSRPDFAIALYPGHLWKKPGLTLEPSIRIAADCPPTLIVAASDDPTDDPRHSLTYYLALQQAKIPVEMHLYAHGGHAFAVRKTSDPVSHWPELAEKWMKSIGMLVE